MVTREAGKEEMRSIVEKEDVGVDNEVPVCVCRVDGPPFSARVLVSVCRGCRYKERQSEGPLRWT